MKKAIWMAFAAAMLLACPAVQAQKVNKDSFLGKIAKSDADIADAKKNGKAATWINRGKLFYDAAVAPTKDIFVGMPVDGEGGLKLAWNEPQSEGSEVVFGKQYTTWIYPYVTVYIEAGRVAAWKQTQVVVADAAAKAIEAYAKAYELDPKTVDKVKKGLDDVANFCSQAGNVGLDTNSYTEAADNYVLAYKAQSVCGTPEAQLLYYAGYLRTVTGNNNPADFIEGSEYLSKALEAGYTDPEGMIYYYLYHCYYGQKDADKANLLKAKDALLAGWDVNPKNERIVDGLISLYTIEEGLGDTQDLIGKIEGILAENPDNVDMWFDRGRVYYALKDYDESIASFLKVVELNPDMYEGNYFLGVFYVVKGDDENEKMNAASLTSTADWNAAYEKVNDIYRAALPWLEKAHELNPKSVDPLQFLKSLCFRLRDDEGMQAKYDHYNELFKQLSE